MIRIIAIFVCVLLQSSFSSFVPIFGLTPDFIIIGLVLLASKNDVLDGIKIGVIAGLLQDLVSYGYFGMGLFVKTLSGFSAAFLKKQIFSDNILSKMAIAFIVVIINGAATLIFMNMFYFHINIIKELITVTLPTAVYTGVMLGLILIIREIVLIVFSRMVKYGIRTSSR